MKNKKIIYGLLAIGLTSIFLLPKFVKNLKIKKYKEYLSKINNQKDMPKMSVFLGKKVFTINDSTPIFNSVEYSSQNLSPISNIKGKNVFLGNVSGTGINEDGYPYFFINSSDVNNAIKNNLKYGSEPNPDLRFMSSNDVFVDTQLN
jgi:hypothetical protein